MTPSSATPLPPEATPVLNWPALREWRLAIHAAALKPRTALLGLLIAEHVNASRNWEAWPSQARLAELSGDGDDRRKTRARLAELREAGWIDAPTAGQRGKSARYRLALPTRLGAKSGPSQVGTEFAPTSSELGTDSGRPVGTNPAPRVGTDLGRDLALNPCPDVPSTTEGVAREHLQTGSSDPASAGAEPVAVTRYVSIYDTGEFSVAQR